MKTLEEIREFFKNDRFATENGAVIDEVGENYARCSLDIKPVHLNAMGSLMGGVSFMLSDFAFAVAANHGDVGTVSLNSNIAFIGKPKSNKLIATAHCEKDGKSTCCYIVKVEDEIGTLITEMIITGYKLIKH